MKQLLKKQSLLFILVLSFTFFCYIIIKQIKNTDYSIPEKYETKSFQKSNKYLIFNEGMCGWADRIKGIMSAYGISMLLDRQFLIKMTKPCHITTFLHPNQINWNQTIEELILKGDLNSNFTSVNFTHRIGFANYSELLSLANQILDQKYKDIDVIYLNTNYYLLHLKKKVLNLNLMRFFKMWINRLFKLSPIVQHEYNHYLNMLKPHNKTKIFCAQIRSKYKSQFSFNQTGAIKYYNYINENFIKPLNRSKDYRIFVTSDDDLITKDALNYFEPNRVVFTNDKAIHFEKITDCTQNIKMVLDFFLLSNCDQAVYGIGGFGRLALFNRVNPEDKVKILISNN